MIFGESGVDRAYLTHKSSLYTPKERFSRKPSMEEVLEPFKLTQLMAAFYLLAIGLVASVAAMLSEKMITKMQRKIAQQPE